ncbi:LLM class flavin-dependent oxidoreductase [Vineibacter terrae]|uniref:LLM class flavin-dependent oxidoreductase n=1 Tax=Vineibacter terrae TaxID=2586908 RepID=UPI002E325E28|nr:LLM class flavin-dependent oxidoreductase [Vineibacter terrae]HEX2885481.1 LLM class flavin-dependent oxidoreductase [Vineibacter terrae]
MANARQLHLNLNFLNAGTFASAWRWHASTPADFADVQYYVRAARLAERGTFDSVFLADFPALSDRPEHRPFQSLEPTITLATIAAATRHIGLIATASSTYNEPYNIARRFASLDHASGGRAGLNIVTTADQVAGRNFGLPKPPPHHIRYERAAEFADVVKSLWDSWEDDAFVGDKASSRFVDTRKVHPIHHRGTHFSVEGALNVPRPPQGRPIVVQAGGSDDGRDLAAQHADAVFSVAHSLGDAIDYARDLRARAVRYGRSPDDILIFPGLVTVIGSTEAEARRREQELWDLVPIEYGLGRLAGILQVDPQSLKLDEPLPAGLQVPVDGMQTFFKGALTLAARGGGLTVRELIRAQGGGTGHRIVVGTPEQIAEGIEEWFRSGAVAGFNVMPDVIETGLDAFVEQVVPLLRRRGIFRHDYEGTTLRDHFGLSRPARGWRQKPPAPSARALDAIPGG